MKHQPARPEQKLGAVEKRPGGSGRQSTAIPPSSSGGPTEMGPEEQTEVDPQEGKNLPGATDLRTPEKRSTAQIRPDFLARSALEFPPPLKTQPSRVFIADAGVITALHPHPQSRIYKFKGVFTQ